MSDSPELTARGGSPRDTRELRDYLFVLRRRAKVMALVVIVTVGAALGFSLLQDDVYQSEAKVLLVNKTGEALFNPNTGLRNDPEREVETEKEIIRSNQIESMVEKALGSSPSIRVNGGTDTNIISIFARSNDAAYAAKIANIYADKYVEFKRDQARRDLVTTTDEYEANISRLDVSIAALTRRIGATPGPQGPQLESLLTQRDQLTAQKATLETTLNNLNIQLNVTGGGTQKLASATVSTVPVEPRPVRTAALAFFTALLLAIALAFLVDYLDDSVKVKEDLERATGGLPVIGLIPAFDGRERTAITLVSDWKSGAAESYRALRTSIQFMGLDQPLHTIQVTSPNAAEGKTTTIANVGVALAGIGVRVVLVDLDLRRPRLHEVFNVENNVGFTSVLLGRADIDDVMTSMLAGNDLLSVLPCGPIPPNPSELLSSPRVPKLLADLRQRADIVLLDTPPILPVTDSLIVSREADAVILVTSVGTTSRRELSRAVELLRQVGAPLAGTVLNRAEQTDLYGYGYGYGTPYGASESRRARRWAGKRAAPRREPFEAAEPPSIPNL